MTFKSVGFLNRLDFLLERMAGRLVNMAGILFLYFLFISKLNFIFGILLVV